MIIQLIISLLLTVSSLVLMLLIVDSKMCSMLLIFPLFISSILCDYEEVPVYSLEEFKCSLPDVTSIDSNLDVTRFRSDFSKISEVKFPGLIGPLNERLICKIKCIDGNWVGPLCSSTPDGRFQPILRECMYRHDHPLLAISFKNSSIEKDTHFPHGSIISARCRHFGLYKLKGENNLRCENGEWAPAFPECVPTTVITNFTGDAPPTIQYSIVSGSGTVGPLGQLQVYPESVVQLDCVSPRGKGAPHWSWQAPANHAVAWSSEENESDTLYRVTLRELSARHTDTFTCTTPGSHTHTVTVTVVNVSCPPMNISSAHMRRFNEGLKLGQSQHFSCQPGFHLQGESVIVCMGDGRWSSPALDSLEPHLTVVEMYASWGDRAVFIVACDILPSKGTFQPAFRHEEVTNTHPWQFYICRWSSPAPTCEQTLCPALDSLGPHLTVVEMNASWGGRAVFRCSWGYRLSGAPGLECEPDGTWSGAVPTCTPIYCPNPIIPENGHLLTDKRGKYIVGDLMTYSCNSGFQILGEPSIVCTENGFWSHPPPFCLPPSEIRKSDTIYVENTTLVHVEE